MRPGPACTGLPAHQGRLAAYLAPLPTNPWGVEFLYKRPPRPLLTVAETAGTVAVVGATLTGAGTSFTSGDVGSVCRLSADSVRLPTNEVGDNPAFFEAQIVSVDSPTALTLDYSGPQILDHLAGGYLLRSFPLQPPANPAR